MNGSGRQNEAALAAAARQGDKNSLQELLRRNWAWIKALVYNYTGRAENLDDILQDICVRVIEKIGSLREPERFRPWLATLARNEATAFYRRKGHQFPCLDPDEIIQADEKAPVPSEQIEGRETMQQLLHAIRELPDKYREVLLMACTEQISYEEMAATLDVPVTTVQIRLVRARRMVRQRLAGKETTKIPRS
ncbi:MAG: sigma-70 family RNA polymerase sigma factor [Phycisphaerae bacterium]|nr:sigma-70 family RNA polymerase sigma factor [Phycisphaerae bacterium]